MSYVPAADRYDRMIYNRVGRSGLKLPAISLGFWHNFGAESDPDIQRAICHAAFDAGITHFDLANNYGPPPGAAETAVGEILASDFKGLRDELVISSKAGWDMWPVLRKLPYGDFGSRKYLIASCDQSRKRLRLDYVDIFYSHRFDPETPLEENPMENVWAYLLRTGLILKRRSKKPWEHWTPSYGRGARFMPEFPAIRPSKPATRCAFWTISARPV